jgi:hypothetical protein
MGAVPRTLVPCSTGFIQQPNRHHVVPDDAWEERRKRTAVGAKAKFDLRSLGPQTPSQWSSPAVVIDLVTKALWPGTRCSTTFSRVVNLRRLRAHEQAAMYFRPNEA